jgi:GntR family transcriptional regulator
MGTEQNSSHPRSAGGSTRGRQTSTRRVRDLIRATITSGELNAGNSQRLEEDSLVHEMAASRNAIRGALQQLRDEGLVERHQRTGTRVSGAVMQVPLYEMFSPVLEGEVTFRWLEDRLVPATAFIQNRLRVDIDRVRMVEHLFVHRGDVIGLGCAYLDPKYSVPMDSVILRIEDAFRLIFGCDLGVVATVIEAGACDVQTARVMSVAPGAPVLTRQQVHHDSLGRPRVLMFTHFRADRVALVSDAVGPN